MVRVPVRVAEIIKAGNYGRISPELLPTWRDESTGKTFKNVVLAAGLLGAKLPAMTTLSDVFKLYEIDPRESVEIIQTVTADWADTYDVAGTPCFAFYSAEYSPIDDGGGEPKMPDIEKLESKIEDLKSRIQVMETTNNNHVKTFSAIADTLGVTVDPDGIPAAIKAVMDDRDAIKSAFSSHKKSILDERINGVVENAKLTGKLIPADEPMIRRMISGMMAESDDDGKLKFTGADGKESTGGVLDAVSAYFARAPKVVELGKQSGGVDHDNKTPDPELPDDVKRWAARDGSAVVDDESAAVDAKVRKMQTANPGMNYESCLNAITGASKTPEPDGTDRVSE
jgi:hypothetical protein